MGGFSFCCAFVGASFIFKEKKEEANRLVVTTKLKIFVMGLGRKRGLVDQAAIAEKMGITSSYLGTVLRQKKKTPSNFIYAVQESLSLTREEFKELKELVSGNVPKAKKGISMTGKKRIILSKVREAFKKLNSSEDATPEINQAIDSLIQVSGYCMRQKGNAK